jgi:hypothetical protein
MKSRDCKWGAPHLAPFSFPDPLIELLRPVTAFADAARQDAKHGQLLAQMPGR